MRTLISCLLILVTTIQQGQAQQNTDTIAITSLILNEPRESPNTNAIVTLIKGLH